MDSITFFLRPPSLGADSNSEKTNSKKGAPPVLSPIIIKSSPPFRGVIERTQKGGYFLEKLNPKKHAPLYLQPWLSLSPPEGGHPLLYLGVIHYPRTVWPFFISFRRKKFCVRKIIQGSWRLRFGSLGLIRCYWDTDLNHYGSSGQTWLVGGH